MTIRKRRCMRRSAAWRAQGASVPATACRGRFRQARAPGVRPGFLVRALGVLLMTVGALTLLALLGLAGRLVWTHRLGEFWTKALAGWTF